MLSFIERKSEETYTKAFESIKSLIKTNFKNVVVDFEISLKNSIYKVFKSENIFGCNFHYVQCLWRKMQKLGLSGEYLTNVKFKSFIRMILNLVFVPLTSQKRI